MSRPSQLVSAAWFGLRSARALHVLLVVGMVPIIALAAAIPAYAQSASARVLAEELAPGTVMRPTFAHLIGHSGSLDGPVRWADIRLTNDALSTRGELDLGLPLQHTSELVESIGFEARQDGERLRPVNLATLRSDASRVSIIAGVDPASIEPGSIPVVPVAIAADIAQAEQLRPGSTLTLFNRNADVDSPLRNVEVVISALWEAQDVDDPTWIVSPSILEEKLLTSAEWLSQTVGSEPGVRSATWQFVTDPSGLTTDDVPRVIARTQQLQRSMQTQLDSVQPQVDPIDELQSFEQRARDLQQQLTVLSLPVVGLMAIFMAVVVSLRNQHRASESALLRSRGASRAWFAGRAALEALAMVAGAALLAAFLVRPLATITGRISSFLQLEPSRDFRVSIPQASVTVGLTAVVILWLALFLTDALRERPSLAQFDPLGTSRTSARAGLWPAAEAITIGLAAAACILSVTGAFGGTVNPAAAGSPSAAATTSNVPAAAVVIPSLVAVAIGVLAIRALPALLGLVGVWLKRTGSVSALLATRRLARSGHSRFLPLLLLVSTVAIGVATASLAQTLDLQLRDRASHQVGADVQFQDAWALRTPTTVSPDGTSEPEGATISQADLLSLPGVAAATRIDQLTAEIDLAATPGQMDLIAIDPRQFNEAAFWRDDYASPPLATLINRLETIPHSVLVSRSLGLQLGDTFDLTVLVDAENVQTPAVVAGVIDAFPTWSPNDDAELTGNRDLIIMDRRRLQVLTGEEFGYRTLVRLSPGGALTNGELRDLGFAVGVTRAGDIVQRNARLPDRQGVFGLLTVGFWTSLVLAVSGLVFTSVRAAQQSRRDMQLVHALGASTGRSALIVTLEMLLLGAVGLVTGVVTGLGLSRWLLPHLLDAPVSPPALLTETDFRSATIIAAVVTMTVVVMAPALLHFARRRLAGRSAS